MPFHGDVVVQAVTGRDWVLVRDLTYVGRDQTFVVPAGTTTDFASVPRPFVWLLPPYGAYTKAAILHDYLVRPEAGVSRADADGIFRRAMRELGVQLVRRWMMWAAVRFASGLTGAAPADVLRFLVVAVPSALFVAIPGVVVLVWLLAFWLIELAVFVVAKPFSGATVSPPHVDIRTS